MEPPINPPQIISHIMLTGRLCAEKKRGRLVMRSPSKLNKALHSKWSWRFAIEREFLWRKVISSKIWHGLRGLEH